MILSPLLSLQLRPKAYSWIKQTRSIRPSIKVGKDKFQLTLDVRNFNRDEIQVKARPEYVIIEGKQEKKTKRGLMMRQFVRKFKLPEGCSPESMESKLSPDGMLTITAQRKVCDTSLPCETSIPISFTEPPKDQDESLIPVKDPVKPGKEKNVCAKYYVKENTKTTDKPPGGKKS